jgi:hypothetical protein
MFPGLPAEPVEPVEPVKKGKGLILFFTGKRSNPPEADSTHFGNTALRPNMLF